MKDKCSWRMEHAKIVQITQESKVKKANNVDQISVHCFKSY